VVDDYADDEEKDEQHQLMSARLERVDDSSMTSDL